MLQVVQQAQLECQGHLARAELADWPSSQIVTMPAIGMTITGGVMVIHVVAAQRLVQPAIPISSQKRTLERMVRYKKTLQKSKC